LSDKLAQIKNERDQTIQDIFERKSDKIMLIIGLCSADNEDAVCEYISRRAALQ